MKIRTARILVNILMTVCFLLAFTYNFIFSNEFHIIVGWITAALFAVHVGLNMKWMLNTRRSIKDGKSNKVAKKLYRTSILLIIVWTISIITAIPAEGWGTVVEGGYSSQQAMIFSQIHMGTAAIGLIIIIVHIVST